MINEWMMSNELLIRKVDNKKREIAQLYSYCLQLWYNGSRVEFCVKYLQYLYHIFWYNFYRVQISNIIKIIKNRKKIVEIINKSK